MADAIACWLRGGWDLSFLDRDPMRCEHSSVDGQDQRTNRTACNDSRHCRKRNSLALIVRRRRIHSYTEISPLPLHSRKFSSTSENAEPQTERCCSNSSTEQVISSHPVYDNITTACETLIYSEPPPALPPRLTVSPTGSRRRCPPVASPFVQPSSSSCPTGSRLLMRPAAASFCRISASPAAADDCFAFSYCRDAEKTDADLSKLELCQWRRRPCFTAWDEEVLSKTFDRLNVSGFYFGRLSFDDAKRLLRCCSVGTFLLRDSSDERLPFSLSVQTQRGVTSIRIICESGLFRLDSEQEQIHLMPTFDCVIQLIQLYVDQSTNNGAQSNFVLLQMNGQRDVPVLLRRPLERRPSTLSHLCRKRINGTIGSNSVNRLPLIPSLKVFLTDYPFDI